MLNEHITKQYDEEFKKVEGLTWLPWVGKNYEKSEHKILIVAESVYANEDTPKEVQERIAKINKNETFVRQCIFEAAVDHDWITPTYDNLHRALIKTNDFDYSLLWNNIAFYNFVQRPMDYTIRERPNDSDYFENWGVFLNVIDVLKPAYVLFVGVEASNSFDSAMEQANEDYEPVKKVIIKRKTHGRTFSVTRNERRISMVAIQHTSQFFSWADWHKFLIDYAPLLLKQIYSYLDFKPGDVELIDKKIKENLDKIPVWLKHKPIIACDYSKIEPRSDAKFMSIGKAQWNNNVLSAKIFRKPGKRWSMQSEEIPVSRVPDLFLMLLNAIRYSNPEIDQSKIGESYLHEGIINEDDISFLKKALQNNNKHLNESLKEIKRILNAMNLDEL